MTAPTPTSLAAFLADRVKSGRRRYRKRLERCQRKFSESAVHDLRVETRRFLALLDLLRALRVPGPLGKVRKVFKRRLDAFDELRDTQVQLSLLRPLGRQFPAVGELDALLRRRERRLTGELRQGVHATKQARAEGRLKALEKRLRGAADETPRRAAPEAVLTALREAFDQVVTVRRRVRPNRIATIHRTRVAFKRFRYLCELLRPYLPGLNTAGLGRMRDYQAMMGDIQDMEVVLAGVGDAVADKEIGARTVGQLRRELRRRQRELVGIYLAATDRLSNFDPNLFAALGEPLPDATRFRK